MYIVMLGLIALRDEMSNRSKWMELGSSRLTFVVLAAALPLSKTLITTSERQLIAEFATAHLRRLSARWSRSPNTVEANHAV